MGGISTRNFKMFRELCGDSTLKNVVIVTNMWGEVSSGVAEARERELATDDMFFKPVLDQNARLVRHDNTRGSAQAILQLVIPNHPEALRIQRELVDEHMDISQTAAAEELNRELIEQAKRHQADLKELEAEMKVAIKQQDEETRKELEVEYRKLHKEMERVEHDSKRLASEYNEEKLRMEKMMAELVEQAKRDQETTQQRFEQKLQELEAKCEEEKKAQEKRMEEAAAQKKKEDDETAAKFEAKLNDIAEKTKQDNEAAATKYRKELDDTRKAAAAERAEMQQAMANIQRQNEERLSPERKSEYFAILGKALQLSSTLAGQHNNMSGAGFMANIFRATFMEAAPFPDQSWSRGATSTGIVLVDN
jgi:hypothetical protein